jgi:hypothetical protein
LKLTCILKEIKIKHIQSFESRSLHTFIHVYVFKLKKNFCVPKHSFKVGGPRDEDSTVGREFSRVEDEDNISKILASRGHMKPKNISNKPYSSSFDKKNYF